MNKIRVALAPLLLQCPGVITLGIRPTMGDYSSEARELLLRTDRVFFPTPRFAGIFQAIRKETFPNAASYAYPRSRLHQELLFQYLDLPHPRSRIYFGAGQKNRILSDFPLPFLAMSPGPASGCTHVVRDPTMLGEWAERYNPIIIQEAVQWLRRIRLVCFRFQCVGSFEWTTTSSESGFWRPIVLEHPVLRELPEPTERILVGAGVDDIQVEWGFGHEQWQIIQLVRPPTCWQDQGRTVRRLDHVCRLIRSGLL